MHELSIAMGMADELTRLAKENHATKVLKVNLKIGKMSGIVTDSLKFVFDAIKIEHPVLTSAEILIEEVPVRYECKDCRNSFTTDNIYFPSCPSCKSYNLRLVSGEEMNIENLEVEI